jgi:hypothetical protein
MEKMRQMGRSLFWNPFRRGDLSWFPVANGEEWKYEYLGTDSDCAFSPEEKSEIQAGYDEASLLFIFFNGPTGGGEALMAEKTEQLAVIHWRTKSPLPPASGHGSPLRADVAEAVLVYISKKYPELQHSIEYLDSSKPLSVVPNRAEGPA